MATREGVGTGAIFGGGDEVRMVIKSGLGNREDCGNECANDNQEEV